MKKIYGALAAALLSVLLVLTGCSLFGGGGSSKVLNYLKTQKEFEGNPSKYETYRVTLSVADDLSYRLSIAYGTGELKNYTAEGTEMEYLGCEESEYTTEWLGVTQNNKFFSHVVKLPEATVTMNERDYTFYLIAGASSKRSDTFTINLVAYAKNPNITDVPDKDNLSSIVKASLSFTLKKK